MIAQVVDDLLITGHPSDVDSFLSDLGHKFTIGSIVRGRELILNKLKIQAHSDGSISVNMNNSLRDIDIIPLETSRRKLFNSPCNDSEISHTRRVPGEVNYIGYGVSRPPAILQVNWFIVFAIQLLHFHRVTQEEGRQNKNRRKAE